MTVQRTCIVLQLEVLGLAGLHNIWWVDSEMAINDIVAGVCQGELRVVGDGDVAGVVRHFADQKVTGKVLWLTANSEALI